MFRGCVMGEIQLSGIIEYSASKRGIRYCQLHIAQPYHHSAFLDVTWDEERQTDDDLNDDMLPYYGNAVVVNCTIDRFGDLSTTPSQISLVDAPNG